MVERINLLDYCAQILQCSVRQLRQKINYPDQRAKLLRELIGHRVQTIYEDRNGVRKIFTFEGLTRLPAIYQLAYGNLAPAFNVSISAHFYARHRIRLSQPFLPCVIEQVGFTGAMDNFYPLELLELVPENSSPTVRQFQGGEETDSDEFDEGGEWGRNELSQYDDDGPCPFCGNYH